MQVCSARSILACLVGCLVAVASGQTPESVSLNSLAEPSAEVQTLLRRAGVKFTSGDRSEDSAATETKKLSAETAYRISYDYQSRTQWNTTDTEGAKRVTVTIHYSAVELKFEHTVWFRRCPDRDRFWQDKLVLHELDHVKISSDRRLADRFKQMLSESNVIIEEFSPTAVINSRLINRLVHKRTEQVFSQLNQLVAIRYQELDRVTNHGIKPIPDDSILNELLRASAGTP
jgi:hypothetical protein